MIRRSWVARAAPTVALGAWLVLAMWWTHGFRAFTSFSAARIGAGAVPRPSPPLPVLDERGERWDVAAQSDRYRLVQAMYLGCPDVCPVAMARLGLIIRHLPEIVPGRLQVISLSVDHDPPAALQAMWTAHGSPQGWTMASLVDGPPEATMKRLGVWMQRRRDGLINHGLDLVLLDPAGEIVDVLSPDDDPVAIADRIRREIR